MGFAASPGVIGGIEDVSEEIVAAAQIRIGFAELLLVRGLLVQFHSLEQQNLKLKQFINLFNCDVVIEEISKLLLSKRKRKPSTASFLLGWLAACHPRGRR